MGLGFCFQAVQETKGHVEKKQALTYEEIEAEREEVRGDRKRGKERGCDRSCFFFVFFFFPFVFLCMLWSGHQLLCLFLPIFHPPLFCVFVTFAFLCSI